MRTQSAPKSIWFPEWAAVLATLHLKDLERIAYRRAIGSYLRFCKESRQRATVASARQFMQQIEGQRRLGVSQLANVALEAKANLEFKQSEVVADAGYYNASEVSRCVEQNIQPLIPKADTSANTKLGLYGKNKFQFDAQRDVYVCPAGGQLTYRFSTYELGRELRYYRARGCQHCALKKQCTRNQRNRTLTREAHEHLMEAMALQMKREPEKFKLRKQLAEHPFGTIKRAMGYTHFLLKGLEKVRAEWSLITLVYNLKRVLKLVSLPKLMAAVG